MRHGIPIAGNFLQQELAILTGAVEAMVVDVQCLMPGLGELTRCFHTKLITTSPKAKMPDVTHIEFDEDRAQALATEILELAVDNYGHRDQERVYIPLRGAAGVIGCSNPNVDYETGHIGLVTELLKNDVLVVTTGCDAIACAKHGLLRPEAAAEYAGEGLQEICRAVGIPPVLHLGSCVDNSRILRVLSNVVAEGGLGNDLGDLPVAGAAPEWMSEKAVSIGFYFVASGVFTVIGQPLPMMGSENVRRYLCEEIEEEVGGKWAFELDPVEAAHLMLRHIDKKRKALKLKPMMYEQPFKPEE
jgi:carbon-monoxide dehydrogenase catalytic subunit